MATKRFYLSFENLKIYFFNLYLFENNLETLINLFLITKNPLIILIKILKKPYNKII